MLLNDLPNTDPDQRRIREGTRPPYDLVLQGGRILDPATGTDRTGDIAFAFGRVAGIRDHIAPEDAIQVLDVSGLLVTPGLVDFHVHAYSGVTPLSLPIDEYSLRTGVTTAVSAGDAGCSTFEGFVEYVVRRARTRMFGFVNISRTGLASYPVGELRDLLMLDVQAAAAVAREYREVCLGIKVRMTSYIVGANGMEPLRRAIAAAELAQTPLMVHIYDIPGTLPELLALLRPGDIVTHVFMGTANGILDENGMLIPEVIEARRRGIRFDVGHGSKAGFSLPVAKAALEQGFYPDAISTDLHTQSVNGSMQSLPAVMSKLWALGMPLQEVVLRTTHRPAQLIDRVPLLGTMATGAPGDAAVFRLTDSAIALRDDLGHEWPGSQGLEIVHTVCGGRLVGGPYRHPLV
ncbi:MAG: amidohydrolase/deacetylase family metallohydrolase [Anaerolineae bacterium]